MSGWACAEGGRPYHSDAKRVIFPVFIELPSGGTPPFAVAALVEACSASAAGRICQLSGSARAADSDVVATVDFVDHDQRLAMIHIGLGRVADRAWQTRRVEFRQADDTMERWRSVGLVIGALAADYTHRPERPPAPETAMADPPAPAAHPVEERGLSIDGGFVGGVALNGAPWTAGPYVRASFLPGRVPVAVTISFRYEKDVDGGQDFDLEFASGSVGAAARVTLGALGMQGRLELLRQLIVLSAKDDASGVVERRGRWHTGARAGLDADVHLTGSLFVVGGADATLLDAPTRIQVRNVGEGEAPSLAFAAVLGLRWSSDVGW
jgi:hypothetical protein